MLVKDLIEQLQSLNPNAEVHFSYNYGDHWRTQVAPRVGEVSEGVVVRSEYHRMDKLVDKLVDDEEDVYDEDTGDYAEGVRRVVVLS